MPPPARTDLVTRHYSTGELIVKGRIFLFLAIVLAALAVLLRFFPFDRTPPEVTLAPEPGAYNEEILVAFSSEPGADIYFARGDEGELPYLGPVRIRENTLIRYFARDRWGNQSEIKLAQYTVRLDSEPPETTPSPRAGRYSHPVSLRFKTEKGAVTYYTIDGSQPGQSSPVFGKAITLRDNTVLKFFSVDEAGNLEEVKTAKYVINVDTAKPVTLVDPAGGLFNSDVTVALAGEKGSKIYYSLDGRRPTTRSPLYTEPVRFTRSGVVRFFSVDKAGNRENVREERYVIDRSPPKVSPEPAGGVYPKGVVVKLNSSERGQIRYEVGGQAPTASSPLYRIPIKVDTTTTISFFAVDRAGNRSRPVSAKYDVDRTPPAITALPPGGSYSGRIRVKLESSEPATIFYTLDGQRPTTSSQQYRGPVTVSRNLVLSYFAVDRVKNSSSVSRQKYILDRIPPETAAEPAGATYSGPIEVSLASEAGAVIRFTTDGTTPIEASSEYSRPVRLSRDTILKFYATDESGNREQIRVERYSFDTTPPSTTIAPKPGTYNRPVSVSMSSEKGGKIFFRMENNSDFSAYQSPFVLDKSSRMFFYSIDQSGNREGVQMVEYVIDTSPPRTVPYPAPGQYNPPHHPRTEE